MRQHSILADRQGQTIIEWDRANKQFRVRSNDPLMVPILVSICAEAGIASKSGNGFIEFVGPDTMWLRAEDFDELTRARISWGLAIPTERAADVVDLVPTGGVQGEAILEMSTQGTLDSRRRT